MAPNVGWGGLRIVRHRNSNRADYFFSVSIENIFVGQEGHREEGRRQARQDLHRQDSRGRRLRG